MYIMYNITNSIGWNEHNDNNVTLLKVLSNILILITISLGVTLYYSVIRDNIREYTWALVMIHISHQML